MARKAIVDKDIILDLLKKGETTQRIATRFKVSRQAIDLHRKEFIKNGLLPDKRATRSGKETIQPDTYKTANISGTFEEPQPAFLAEQALYNENVESLDAQIDLLISAFNALKRLPIVEKEIETLKIENEKARQEIERLKAIENKRLDQENRWRLIKTEDVTDSHQE
jgi:hypothetical protein